MGGEGSLEHHLGAWEEMAPARLHSESHVDWVWLQVRRLKYVGMEGKIMIFLTGEMLDSNHFYPVQTSDLIL